MKSNKQKWAQRHEEGKTKFDVASEAQIAADAAKIAKVAVNNARKTRELKVDAQAEAALEGATKVELANKKKQAERDEEANKAEAGVTKAANEVKAGKEPSVPA